MTPCKTAMMALALILASLGAAARAQDAQAMNDEDYIHARGAHYRELGTAAKAIVDEMKTGKPKPATVRTAALQINRSARQQYGWFRPGSGPESEEKTKALPVIWEKPALFKAAQDRFLEESNRYLAAVNAAPDPMTTAPQFKSLVAACSSCHETFRKD